MNPDKAIPCTFTKYISIFKHSELHSFFTLMYHTKMLKWFVL